MAQANVLFSSAQHPLGATRVNTDTLQPGQADPPPTLDHGLGIGSSERQILKQFAFDIYTIHCIQAFRIFLSDYSIQY